MNTISNVCAVFLLTMAGSVAAEEVSHCQLDEKIIFSCNLGQKIISLCSVKKNSKIFAFEYRYGKQNSVEMKFTANGKNDNKFYAVSEPVNPRAQVDQLWFERNDYKYLMVSCRGGDCPVRAGLIVYKDNKPISKKSCDFSPSGNTTFDLPEGVFTKEEKSNSFIEYKDEYFDLSPLYPIEKGQY